METMETTEQVSLNGMEKCVEKLQLVTNRPLCRGKSMADLEKVFANLWSGRKIAK
jgi:hypothetical protein